MKNNFLKLFGLFPLLLSSCSSDETFTEKDSYELNLSIITSNFVKAYDNIDNKFNYYAFESDSTFKGSLDPLENEVLIYNDELNSQYISNHSYSPADYFFPSYDGYKVTNSLSLKQKHFVYFNYANNKYDFTFLRTNGKVNVTYDKLPLMAEVNIIENNNLRAYNINFVSTNDLMNPSTDDQRMFYCLYLLYVTENLPYNIYFSKSNIYLVPKDNSFSKCYLKYFNDYNNLHYFNINKVKKYADEMKLVIR